MNAGCRWDGGDCLGTCGAPTAAGDQCYIEQLGNGECDPECMSADCNYDYRDCECANVLDACDGVLQIPCFGVKNSLNVATAGSIFLFEALRQWDVEDEVDRG